MHSNLRITLVAVFQVALVYFIVTIESGWIQWLLSIALFFTIPWTIGVLATIKGKRLYKIRTFGTETNAEVTKISAENDVDGRHTNDYIKYKFKNHLGKVYTGGFSYTKNQSRFKIGDTIKVKYLPSKPKTNEFIENLDFGLVEKELIEIGDKIKISSKRKEKAIKFFKGAYGVKH